MDFFFKLTKNLLFLPRLSLSHLCIGFHAPLAAGVKAACSGIYFFLQMGPPGGGTGERGPLGSLTRGWPLLSDFSLTRNQGRFMMFKCISIQAL